MIKINILLAIYTYNNDIHRTNLTEKIFKHYMNIVEKFKDEIEFSFTILGSENDTSKMLSLKYFKFYEYIEYDQKSAIFGDDFYKMLACKIRYGMNVSKQKNTDIIFWGGSNDYICFDFFRQIIDYYNPKKPQIYGIDNYKNGNNAVFMTHYDGNKNIKFGNDTELTYWWDGVSDYCGRQKYNYCGGIIGVNKQCCDMYPDILLNWNFDEGQVEEYILKKPNIDKFNSKNLFWMNIKTLNQTEITPFEILKKYNEKNILNFNYFSKEFKKKYIAEFNYFNKL
jgi:hypothetical protein